MIKEIYSSYSISFDWWMSFYPQTIIVSFMVVFSLISGWKGGPGRGRGCWEGSQTGPEGEAEGSDENAGAQQEVWHHEGNGQTREAGKANIYL